jgi:hypothetical protein
MPIATAITIGVDTTHAEIIVSNYKRPRFRQAGGH